VAEEPLAAAYRAIRQTAVASAEIWGQKAFADYGPSGAVMPYLVYFWLGGGERHLRTRPDAEFLIAIKGVSRTQEEAFRMAARIEALFNDRGVQDVASGYLSGGVDWQISTSTKGLHIHLVEYVSGATPIYHEGHQYRFLLQRT